VKETAHNDKQHFNLGGAAEKALPFNNEDEAPKEKKIDS
jgi:hypothetical protein